MLYPDQFTEPDCICGVQHDWPCVRLCPVHTSSCGRGPNLTVNCERICDENMFNVPGSKSPGPNAVKHANKEHISV